VIQWFKKIAKKMCWVNEPSESPAAPILMIKPDYNFFPVGLTYVASTLERHGYAYDFIDMSFCDRAQLS